METERPDSAEGKKRRSILSAVLLTPVCCWALAFFVGPSLRATAPASIVPDEAELVTTDDAAASKRVWRYDEYVVAGTLDTITAFYRSRAFSCYPTAISDPASYSVDAYTNPIHDMRGGELAAVACKRRIRLARDYEIVLYDEGSGTVRIFSEVNVFPWD